MEKKKKNILRNFNNPTKPLHTGADAKTQLP